MYFCEKWMTFSVIEKCHTGKTKLEAKTVKQIGQWDWAAENLSWKCWNQDLFNSMEGTQSEIIYLTEKEMIMYANMLCCIMW